MMNKKMIALLLAVSTISSSMFAFLGDVVEGTFNAAGTVATAPVDAARATVDPDTTYGKLREERYDRWRENAEDRRERRDNRHGRRYYDYND